MRFGYARVSTLDQDLESQVSALLAAGCDEVLSEKIGATVANRPELARLLDKVRAGDVVVISRLDRLGRSLKHLIEVVDLLKSRGVDLVSLHEQLDTTTATGRMMFHLFAMFAEFERDLISERTKAGLATARARGRHGGRPRSLTDKQIQLAKAALKDERVTVQEVADQLGVSRSTLYRYL